MSAESSVDAHRPHNQWLTQRIEKEHALRALLKKHTPLKVATLPPISSESGARVIIIGDVHGCLTELQQLLKRCSYDEQRDVVVLLGDLVGKGPSSLEVLDFARQMPRCVVLMGNHDWTLLRWFHATRVCDPPLAEVPYSSRQENPYPPLAQQLTREQFDFLSSLPHLLRIPQFDAVCVHAGLDPLAEDPLVHTNPYDAMHMRNVVPVTSELRAALDAERAPDDAPARTEAVHALLQRAHPEFVSEIVPGEPWGARYAGPPHAFFGHDAKRKLQQHAHATGIDTGCCYGGQLTAVILPGRNLVSVASSYSCLKQEKK